MTTVIGVVLAAGESRRMGHPKQLARVGGVPLLVHAIDALGPVVDRVLVVVGAHAEAVRAVSTTSDHAVEFVANPSWRDGMGTSVAAGVARAIEFEARIAVVLACDQPQVDAARVQMLVAALEASPEADAAAAAYDGVIGVPAAFRLGRCGAHLTQLGGTTGARSVLRDDRREVVAVAMPAATYDIDTPDDLAAADGSAGCGERSRQTSPGADVQETMR